MAKTNTNDTVQEDIDEAQSSMSVNIKVTDTKIVCSFSIYNSDNSNGMGSYIDYPKVFDSFAEFNLYAEEFFKEELTN